MRKALPAEMKRSTPRAIRAGSRLALKDRAMIGDVGSDHSNDHFRGLGFLLISPELSCLGSPPILRKTVSGSMGIVLYACSVVTKLME